MSNFPCVNKKYQVILELKVPLLCFADSLQIAAEQHIAFGFLGHFRHFLDNSQQLKIYKNATCIWLTPNDKVSS